ncbi:MAG: S8 family serine peptidase, partial [Desulfatitalea sp.]|nr:helix-hairpin-helix domain-containing protein [Desulfatitalea sp.]NNK02468.1 S8 family serine peptidase [Desulfatitalea sp.]
PYRFKWGTSFAAPHVAGVLALMHAVGLNAAVPGGPRLTAARAKEILIESGDEIDPYNFGFENMLGKRVNARRALEHVMSEIGAVPAPEPPQPPAPEEAARININTATAAQLASLPCISAFYARLIINYRETNGPFPTIESLTHVWGIGPWTVQQIAHLIAV